MNTPILVEVLEPESYFIEFESDDHYKWWLMYCFKYDSGGDYLWSGKWYLKDYS